MGRCIVKIREDCYVEWSTVVDAPVSYTMTRAEAAGEYGEGRVALADANGDSMVDGYRVHWRDWNRAGDGERPASEADIVRIYAKPAVS